MSVENLACCLKCQMTFKTHEELFVHSCAQIKIEKPELEDDNPIEKYVKILKTFDQQDFKHDTNHQDFSPKKRSKKEKKCGTAKVAKKEEKVKPNVRKFEVEGKKKRERPKIKKEEPKDDFDEKINVVKILI